MSDSSILSTVKQGLSISEDIKDFDSELVPIINGALINLYQIGVGNGTPVSITVDDNTDFTAIGCSPSQLPLVKNYIIYKTRIVFDPPANYVLISLQSQLSEIEFRLTVDVNGSLIS